MFDRILGIALILVATLVPASYLEVITYAEVQLVLGTLIVIYILLGDAIAGLLVGIAVLIMYFQAYAYKFGTTWYDVISTAVAEPRKKSSSLVANYVTPDDLVRAQTNIVDPMNANVEMKGIEGVYGEEVYGAQGMDPTIPAFDPENKYMALKNDTK